MIHSKIYECSKVRKALSVCSSLQKCEKYHRKNIGIGIDEMVNHDTKEFIITNIFPDAKWPLMKEENMTLNEVIRP